MNITTTCARYLIRCTTTNPTHYTQTHFYTKTAEFALKKEKKSFALAVTEIEIRENIKIKICLFFLLLCDAFQLHHCMNINVNLSTCTTTTPSSPGISCESYTCLTFISIYHHHILNSFFFFFFVNWISIFENAENKIKYCEHYEM